MNEQYKFWIVLLEDVNYNAENIFNIAVNSLTEPVNEDLIKYNKEALLNINKYMMYNMHFLEKLETFLINNGIIFNWIIYKNEYIGIRIQPSKIDFKPLLIDCLTFEEFSWNRHSYMSINNITETQEIKDK